MSLGIYATKVMLKIDVDKLWRRAELLPTEWLTNTVLPKYASCLGVLSDTNALLDIVELIAGFPCEKEGREFLAYERQRSLSNRILRVSIQGA